MYSFNWSKCALFNKGCEMYVRDNHKEIRQHLPNYQARMEQKVMQQQDRGRNYKKGNDLKNYTFFLLLEII